MRQNLLTTIPRLSTEWSVSFDVTLSTINTGWVNLFHFTIGQDVGKHGDRTPAVFQHPHKTHLTIASSIGADYNFHVNTQELGLNIKHHVDIDQIYVGNGVYNFNVKIDGVNIASQVNTNAMQFYNVDVWANDKWYLVPANAPVLSNLCFVNFL